MALITGLAGFSFTIVATTFLAAQSLEAGARALALANATVTTSGIPFEPINPAVRSGSGTIKASFSIGQGHALTELRYNSLALVVPVRSLQAGVSLASFGFDAYRRTTASLVASTSVLQDARLGLRVTARHVGFQGYGGKTAVGISAGWMAKVTRHIVAGGAWRYIGSAMKPAHRLLPQQLSFGFEARASPEVRILGAVVGESGAGLDLRAGVDINLTEAVTARAGTGTSPDRISFGFGLTVDPGTLNAGVSLHPVLGPSVALSLTLE